MRVLIATDGSVDSLEAARQFARLTHGHKHQVTILYVMPVLTIGRRDAYMLSEQEAEGLSALNAVKAIFDGHGSDIETMIRQGTPADAIIEIARDGGYELIVIGSKGKGGFREMLLGSVTKTILNSAPCSVLIGR